MPESSTARRRPCSKCGINRAESSYTSAKGRVCKVCRLAQRRKGAHEGRVRRTYGITAEEYQAILAVQGGACGGCGEKRTYNLHVEHDHKVERELGETRLSVRGLACARCNSVLRKVRDNPDVLRRLADYLDDWPARKVIQ